MTCLSVSAKLTPWNRSRFVFYTHLQWGLIFTQPIFNWLRKGVLVDMCVWWLRANARWEGWRKRRRMWRKRKRRINSCLWNMPHSRVDHLPADTLWAVKQADQCNELNMVTELTFSWDMLVQHLWQPTNPYHENVTVYLWQLFHIAIWVYLRSFHC